MDLLAIRNGEGQGVYKYNTNGEKSRILSKFSGCSTRVFPEYMLEEACVWAGVDSLVSEEINLWAITKNAIHPNEKNIENIENNEDNNNQFTKIENIICIEKQQEIISDDVKEVVEQKQENIFEEKKSVVMSNMENTKNSMALFSKKMESTKEKGKEEQKKEEKIIENIDKSKKDNIINNEKEVVKDNLPKHTPTSFEHILDVYKKIGSCMLNISMNDGEEYCVIPDTYWYLSKDDRKYRVQEEPLPSCLITCTYLRELILKECSIFKETKTGPKNPVFGEIIAPTMFATIQKTKYLAFGDLVYFSDANFYTYVEKKDENERIYLVAERNTDKRKKDVTINISNIRKITIIPDTQKIEYREFMNLLKKVQKEKELEKLNTKK